ncbi:MAG: amidohydrolase family protein [Saccharofermentans sp.]|nr:amidohydrolase family protein [Saccharofermentans sp.]
MRIIDAHCHIYPEKIASKAIDGISSFYGLAGGETPSDEMALKLKQAGFSVTNKGTVEDLIAKETKSGVTHFLCHSVATDPSQVRSINEFISSAVAKYPGMITGFGSLNPYSEDIRGDLEHLVELGLKGVKLHPDTQRFVLDSDMSVDMCHMIADLGLTVLVHCGDYRYDYSNPDRVASFLKKVPELTVIGAHFGGWSKWQQAFELLPGISDKFYVDLSSSLYALSPESAKLMIRKYGADKVLFGTDYPMWDIAPELRRMTKLGLSKEEKELIYHANAERLLGLDN